MIGSVLIAAAGLVGAAVLYGSVFHEVPLAKGALFEALVEASEGGEDNLTEVFAPFVAADDPLEDRVPPLLANGFRCDMRPASVEDSTMLVCRRPLEGTRYCQGFFYFAYQTASGEIIETLGSTYDARRRANAWGQCDNNREAFFELSGGA
ncbi:hypothetical protein DVH29_15620 [Pelagibacterium lacus]|uniref:Uncharacterized protein n=1 Tax=Pelagibacterium lacus TaxID=2282655 RepID=A0A369W2Z2_9HYPH|nr:hypothetical protein DVH29_15620 [Pelagibacterium lacus]